MRITTKGRYALRAMANLAMNGSTKPKAIKTIAAEEDISAEFLEQIFFRLKKAGVIESVRGPGGGFILTQAPEKVNVKTIFDAVDEGLELSPCSGEKGEVQCPKTDTCLVHDVWREASDHINSFFEGMTLRRIMDTNKHKQFADMLAGSDVALS